MDKNTILNQIARDLELCDLGMALTKGRRRAQFSRHRDACFAEIARMNKEEGLDQLSDDELYAELTA